jgi:hypothetical protein
VIPRGHAMPEKIRDLEGQGVDGPSRPQKEISFCSPVSVACFKAGYTKVIQRYQQSQLQPWQ